MKNLKKLLATMLIVSMVFTTQGVYVLANGMDATTKIEESETSKVVEAEDETSSVVKEEENETSDVSESYEETENSEELESSEEVENSSELESPEETENSEELESSETTETSMSVESLETTETSDVEEKTNETTFESNADEKESSEIVDTSFAEEITTKEVAREEVIESIATISDAEVDARENVDDNKIEVATISNIDNQNTLFGEKEKVASESDVKLPRFIDNSDKYLGNIDEDYIAPYAEPINNGLFGVDPSIVRWDSREHTTGGLSWVSPVRNQSPYGICWAFATAGMVETSIRKKGLATTDEDSNLSELALAYFMYNLKRVTNDTSHRGTPGLQGYDYTMISEQYYIDAGTPEKATFSQSGGNQSLSTKMISSYVGMVVEDENTNFSNDGHENEAMRKAHTEGIAPKYAYGKNGYVANNIRYINRENRDAIKQAIMDNGSVGFSYYSEANTTDPYGYWADAPAFHWEIIDGKKYCYYRSQDRVDSAGRPRTNHAIMIVGWDDNIEARKFYYGGEQPHRDESTSWEYMKEPKDDEYSSATYKSTSNGAWIARNSWGTNNPYLEDGYFYIPYDEQSLSETFYSVDAISADTYKYNYHYDTTGNSSSIHTFNAGSGMNGSFGNIYKVSGTDAAQVIEAVSVGINATNAEYDIKIYTKDEPMTNPADGILRTTKRGSNTLAGFYTFELDDKVLLAKDTYFSVVVEPLGTEAVNLFYDTVLDSSGWYLTYNEAELGQSFYRQRASSTTYTKWVDMNGDSAYSSLKNKIREIDGKLYGNNWRIKALANAGISLSFESNGGEGDMPAQVAVSGSSIKINKNTFKKNGYRFKKWIGSDGNEYSDEEEITITSSLTLTAEWEEASYTFAPGWFDANLIGMTGDQFTSIKLSMYPNASPSNVDASYIIPGSGGLIVSRKGTELNIYAPDKSMSGKIDVSSDASYLFTNTMLLDPMAPDIVIDHANSYKKCENIEGLNLLNTSNVTKMHSMFFGVGLYNVVDPSIYELLPSPKEITLDISSFDTRNVTDMSYMFEQTGIKNIDVDNLSTYSLTDTSCMFAECYYLQSLDLRKFKTATVSDAHGMFTYCSSLTNIDFDTDVFENVTDMSYMFDSSKAITVLNLSGFNTAKVTDMSGMFNDCTALTKIIVSQRKFKLDSLTQSADMFAGCNQLRGGNNTGIAGNPVDATYARLDKPTSPGYFTSIDLVTIVFDLNGKGTNFTDIFEKGTAITRPTDPTYEGYTFVHWYEEGTSESVAYDFSKTIPMTSGDTIRLIAKWDLMSYAVTLNTDGGTIVEGDVTSYTYGTGATLPTNVTKAGFVFKGWWTQNGKISGNWGSEVTEIPRTATGEKTYYAKWAASFIVTFDLTSIAPAPDMSVITNAPSEQNIEDGSNATRPIDPSAINFEFKGWFTNEDGSTEYNFENAITGPTTIYAKWEKAVTYDLIFNVESGKIHPAFDDIKNVPEVQHVVNGKVATKPIDPTATGYKFINWYISDTFETVYDFASAVSENKTIYAKWELQKYTITYEVNGGVFEPEYKLITEREYGKEVLLPTATDITKHGYTFAGWYEDDTFIKSAGTKIDSDVSKDVTLYANWTKNANTFIITFDSNYDGKTVEQAFVLDESVELKTNIFTRTGYTFIRWKDAKGNVYTNANQLTGDAVLYAEWKENSKPSPYVPSGGGGSSSSGSSSRAVGPIPQNQINNNITLTKVSTTKSQQIVVNGNTSQWIYDPVKNAWKMSALDLMGTPVNAANGFYIVNRSNIVLENNVYVQKTTNDTYYFNSEGNMVTGWVQTNDNKWYFFDNAKTLDEGKLCLGWKQIDGAWYFFSTDDGAMLVNTTTADGYRIGADGRWIQ